MYFLLWLIVVRGKIGYVYVNFFFLMKRVKYYFFFFEKFYIIGILEIVKNKIILIIYL